MERESGGDTGRLLGELERQIRAGESDKRIAYLTFDDGPYDNTTDAILDILKEKGVHATFFLRHRPDHVAQIQREIREGHTLANHSYSHKIKAVYQSADSCIKELTFLNTIPPLEGACSKIKYLDVSPIFADAIQRIYEENSMSVLF